MLDDDVCHKNNYELKSLNSSGGGQKMLDLLEDDDDVQNVYHSAEFPEGWDE